MDPQAVGRREAWFAPTHDIADWQSLAPGRTWESAGMDYDGVAWYRTTFTMPAWTHVYLGFGGIDDVAELWINGELAGEWAFDPDGLPVLLELSDYGTPGDVITLAFRVLDTGGYGGIKQRVRLGAAPQAAIDPTQVALTLAAQHPDWPMPAWARGDPYAWTMTGAYDAAEEALFSINGAVAPWARGPSVELWLYDPDTDDLATGPSQGLDISLVEGELPLPQATWQAFDVVLTHTLFHDLQRPAFLWTLTAANEGEQPRALTLLVVVRPFAVTNVAPIEQLGFQGEQRLWINGNPFIVAQTAPAQHGAGSLEDVTVAALRGSVTDAEQVHCDPAGGAAAALAYPLQLAPGEQLTLNFGFPDAPGGEFPALATLDVPVRLADVTAAWQAATGRVRISVPDERITAGIPASIGYLLLALDPDGPHPGPLAHDAVWVRDAAYIGLALLKFGYADAVAGYIPDLIAAQEPDGRVPPIIGENAPWLDDEWDSQGQLMFLIASHYHYTGNHEALETWYPAVRKAAQFLVELRADYDPLADSLQDILPPSKSAEDIGPPDWHHYWDNWWAIAGLESGAELAEILGEDEDRAWMQAEANALRAATLDSIDVVMDDDPSHIPSAVESILGSNNARGTVPVLWPVQVLSPERPLVADSFDVYHQRWIEPSDGGFRHHGGHYWPYGGLELAHAYLQLGRMDVVHQILGWTLSNETLPGTYAWAEQVDPADNSFSGGDMPHAWAAADYIMLIREMLLTERDDALVLFAGAAEWWFALEKEIVLEDAPTHFGPLTLRTESSVVQEGGSWKGTLTLYLEGATPPEGFHWELPVSPLTVHGPTGTMLSDDGKLVIPGGDGIVQLTFVP